MRLFIAILLFQLGIIWGCQSQENGGQVAVSNDLAQENSTETNQEGRGADPKEQIKGDLLVEGTFSNPQTFQNRQVILFETEGRNFFPVDSAIIQNGRFTFDLQNIPLGVYKMGLTRNEKGLGSFILNPKEKQIQLNFSQKNFIYGVSTKSSPENEAYLAYLSIKKSYDQRVVQAQRAQLPSATKRQNIYKIQSELKQKQTELASKNEGTFFAQILHHLQSPERFNQSEYWSDIDFMDPGFIRSPVLTERIEDYMRIHGSKPTSEDKYSGFYKAVDDIAKLIPQTSVTVRDFVMFTISEGFYSSNMEDLSIYVVDNYLYGDDCGDEDLEYIFKSRAGGLKKLQVGNLPPDFALPTPGNSEIKLNELTSKNDLTLVFFWASFCHKCEKEIPLVNLLHNQYTSRGFDILGVSVDTNKKDWLEGIQKKGPKWKHGSDLQGWHGDVAKSYRVSSTPMMFLIDKEGKLVLKTNQAKELAAFLNQRYS